MKWFDKWFARKCKESWDNSSEVIPIHRDIDEKSYAMGQAINKVQAMINRSPSTQSINFQIYPANGGHVVEVYMHENHGLSVNMNPYKSLYIIPSDKDLGESISKIITLEMLKK